MTASKTGVWSKHVHPDCQHLSDGNGIYVHTIIKSVPVRQGRSRGWPNAAQLPALDCKKHVLAATSEHSPMAICLVLWQHAVCTDKETGRACMALLTALVSMSSSLVC